MNADFKWTLGLVLFAIALAFYSLYAAGSCPVSLNGPVTQLAE